MSIDTSPNPMDLLMLQRCEVLAKRGDNRVKSNPKVGAVIVHEDRIIGEGWHHTYGDLHAEREALKNVKSEDLPLLKNAHLYVSLEPCNHMGKTPPCTGAIIENRIPKVTIGHLDPTDKMSGKSVKLLRSQGVQVNVIDSLSSLDDLISPFKVMHFEGRPFVTLKYAISKDGFMGKENEAILLSNPHSGIFTHQLRRCSDAILIGTNTAIVDNPQLTTRNIDGPSPLRIVLDRKHRIPSSHRIFTDSNPTIIVTASKNYPVGDQHKIIYVGETEWDIRLIMNRLYQYGIRNLMVEGGAKLLKVVIHSGHWDHAYQIRTPVLLGTGIKAPYLKGRLRKTYQLMGDKILFINKL